MSPGSSARRPPGSNGAPKSSRGPSWCRCGTDEVLIPCTLTERDNRSSGPGIVVGHDEVPDLCTVPVPRTSDDRTSADWKHRGAPGRLHRPSPGRCRHATPPRGPHRMTPRRCGLATAARRRPVRPRPEPGEIPPGPPAAKSPLSRTECQPKLAGNVAAMLRLFGPIPACQHTALATGQVHLSGQGLERPARIHNLRRMSCSSSCHGSFVIDVVPWIGPKRASLHDRRSSSTRSRDAGRSTTAGPVPRIGINAEAICSASFRRANWPMETATWSGTFFREGPRNASLARN